MPTRGRKRKTPTTNSENSSTVSDVHTAAATAGNARPRKAAAKGVTTAAVEGVLRQSTRKNAGGRLKEFTTAASGKRRSGAVQQQSAKKKPWEVSDDEEAEVQDATAKKEVKKRTAASRRRQLTTAAKRKKRPAVVTRPSDDEDESEDESSEGIVMIGTDALHENNKTASDGASSGSEDEEESSSSGSSSSGSDYEMGDGGLSRSPSRSRDAATPTRDEESILCPWLELADDQLPRLELPCSSTDLLIDKEHLLETLEVYEVLRNFHRAIQLSPFLFEDFCAALRSPAQSKLVCEIHLALIRLLYRDDEEDQTIFATIETSGSFNVMLQLLEPMTFAEALRQYMESDVRVVGVEKGPQALEVLRTENYPFVGVEQRLTVLKWLCERFFETQTFKKLVKTDGKITSDEHCRDCGKQGNVLLCDGCEACYHLKCAGLAVEPEGGLWFCGVCRLHQVRGATDCYASDDRKAGKVKPLSFRIQPLGHDRHGRLYWFTARRLFVQETGGGDEVHYYSTLPQLYELIASLDSQHYERRLCNRLARELPGIASGMRLTLDVTDEKRSQLEAKIKREPAQPYLHVDNAYRMAKILTSCKASSTTKSSKNSSHHGDADSVGPLAGQALELLRIEDGGIVEEFWGGGLSEKQLLQYQRDLHKEQTAVGKRRGPAAPEAAFPQPLLEDYEERSQKGYRLGFSGGEYRDYLNQYTNNDYAKSPYVRAKERDKKKYLGSRFSLADEGEFSWAMPGGCFLNETEVARCIQASLRQLIDRIPDELMHRMWRNGEKVKYLEALDKAVSVGDLKYCLLQFERTVRKPIFMNAWWNSLGHIKLVRITSEDRESKQKTDQARKKEEKSLAGAADTVEEGNVVWVNFRDGVPPRHGVWRQREEQYRLNGRGSLGGWMWLSRTANRRYAAEVAKPPRYVSSQTPSHLLTTPEARRAQRLDKAVKRLLSWRVIDELSAIGQLHEHSDESETAPPAEECYSPTCRLITSGKQAALKVIPFIGVTGELQSKCYSSICPRSSSNYARHPSAVVKAFKPYSSNNPYSAVAVGVHPRPFRETLGLGRAFPYPRPFEYKSRSGRHNLLVLPPMALKALARQGGLLPTNISGFNRLAKANPQLWPYPCARPLFDNCWRYATLESSSLHAVALRLRTLYACIRWADLEPDPDETDIRVWVHHPDSDEVRWVIGHRENPPDGYYEQYRVRVQQYSLDDNLDYADGDDEDDDRDPDEYRTFGSRARTHNNKGKQRKSGANAGFSAKKAMTRRKSGPPHDKWVDGVDLKLWEIVSYWHRYFNRPPPGSVVLQPANREHGHPQAHPKQNGVSRPANYAYGGGARVVLAANTAPYQHQSPAGGTWSRLQPVRDALVANSAHHPSQSRTTPTSSSSTGLVVGLPPQYRVVYMQPASSHTPRPPLSNNQ